MTKNSETDSDQEQSTSTFAKDEEEEEFWDAEEDLPMTNWINIHPNFTKHLQAEWEDHNFSYSQVKEWIDIGLTPQEADFANWLSEEGYTAIALLDYGDSEELRKEYQRSLKEPSNPLKKLVKKINPNYLKLTIAIALLAGISYYLLKDSNKESNAMEDLLIIALLIAGAYYFFIYQPKEAENKPFTQTISTQTEPIINQDEKDLETTLDQLIKNIRQLNREIK